MAKYIVEFKLVEVPGIKSMGRLEKRQAYRSRGAKNLLDLQLWLGQNQLETKVAIVPGQDTVLNMIAIYVDNADVVEEIKKAPNVKSVYLSTREKVLVHLTG